MRVLKNKSNSDLNSADNMAEDFDIEDLLEEPYKKKDNEVSFCILD